jgi:catechol 2,3-dioxygenase-like lactoylglutathione lyase family enzyme
MGRTLMIGGVFLLSRDPERLADWYRRHFGFDLRSMEGDETRFAVLNYRDDAEPASRRDLAFAIMPGEPGEPGQGHIINHRVDDIEAVAASLRADGIEVGPVTMGDDGDGLGKFARLD